MEGLEAMDHVSVRTPRDPELRSGIVTFEVQGMGTWPVIEALREERIIASTTPSESIPRLAPGLLNDHDDVEAVLRAVWALA